MTAPFKVPSSAALVYDSLDELGADLVDIRQLADAIVRLTDDAAVATVAGQMRQLAQQAEERRCYSAGIVHPYAFPSPT